MNWGQGLAGTSDWSNAGNEEKYIFKCVDYLQRNGIDATLASEDFKPHSGAIIGTESHVDIPPWISRQDVDDQRMYDLYYGEIPSGVPSVLAQLKSLQSAEQIDLLFINGGPNDVGITRSTKSERDFDDALRDIIEIAENRLPVLLKKARDTCPNAIIIYSGYYAAISPESDMPPLIQVATDINTFGSALAFLQVYWVGTEFVYALNKKRLKKQGIDFHHQMLARFREQISDFNHKYGAELGGILFSPSGFSPSNAMWARDEWVSAPGNDPNPDVTHIRKRLCKIVDDADIDDSDLDSEEKSLLNKLLDPMMEKGSCNIAYTGHPNKKGSAQYARELKKRLDSQLNFSLRKVMGQIDSSVGSIRKLKKEYPFAPIKSIRGLADIQWLDLITVDWSFPSYDGPTANGLKKLEYDFGWGYQKVENEYLQVDTFDIRGRRPVKDIKRIGIRIQDYSGIEFTLKFQIKVNGYPIPPIFLDENSFRKASGMREWRMSTLNFKREYA